MYRFIASFFLDNAEVVGVAVGVAKGALFGWCEERVSAVTQGIAAHITLHHSITSGGAILLFIGH